MKLNQLTFTRFIAAMAIVIHHDQGNSFPFNTGEGTYVVGILNCLVSYFFTLSGFILVISSNNTGDNFNKKRFWINRVARIYPVYFFALIALLTLALNARTPNTKLTFNETFLSLTVLQAWFPEYAQCYNYPAWSLSVEFLFYLLFPFLFIYLRNKSIKYISILAVSLWVVSLLAMAWLYSIDANIKLIKYFPLLHLNEFVIGMTGGFAFIKYKSVLQAKGSLLLYTVIGMLALVIAAITTHSEFFVKYYHNGLLAPLFILFIIWLSASEGIISNLFSYNLPKYLGEISYALYIIQIPVYVLVSGINDRTIKLSHTPQFYVYVLCLIGSSAICYELIEKPFRNAIKRASSKEKQVAIAK